MKFHGIQLEQGSNVSNLTVAAGTAFPASPDEGELFFRNDNDVRLSGLYLYVNGSWDRIASTDTLTAPNGATLPTLANEGDIFYLNVGDQNEGLYIYKNGTWVNLTAGAAPTFTVTGDVTGTLDGGTDILTLASSGVTPGTYQSITVDAKGRVTAGTNPTTLAGYGITDAQPLDADLTAVAALTGTGVVARVGEGTYAARTLEVTGTGLSITNADGVSGNPSIASNATSDNTASTIVARDASGNFIATGVTLNNLLVSGTPIINAPNTAQFEFREGDQTLPAGRWRLTLDGDAFGLRHNTAVVGDFSTYVSAWVANADNSVTFPAAIGATNTTSGTVRVTGGMGVTGDIFASSFNGSGAALTALNASQLTSGTIPNARVAQSAVTQHQAALTILETQVTDGSLLARNAGNETITGTWTFSNNVTVPADPVSANHAASKQYVDNLVTGLDMKQSVRVATTSNITLSGTQTIDGIAVVAGDRVLVKNQSTASQNGIYVVATGAWTRASDADNTPSNEVNSGMYTFVEAGTVNADSGWVLSTANPITLGSTALTFTQFTGLGALSAGAGLTKTGSTIDVVTASASRIVVNADSIDLAATAISPGTYNSLTVDTYGRAIAGTNDVTGTGTTYVTDNGPTIVNANLSGAATFNDGTLLTSWTTANTDIDALSDGTSFGTLIEGVVSGHFTIGIRSNGASDSFQVISKGVATNPTTDPYTTLAFEVKATGNTTVGGTLDVSGATTLSAPLTINSVDNQLVLRRSASQFLVIENNNVSVSPYITSFSDPANAKQLVFRSTTDDINTALTGGSVGFEFQVYSASVLSIDAGGISWAGTATGNGSGITNLNASSLSTGTVADARLSSNVALRNSSNNFSAFQNIQVAAAGTNQEYLRLSPTDFGTNKPYFTIKTVTGSNDHFQMLLWDGADSNGTISVSASTVNLSQTGGTTTALGSFSAVTSISAGTQFLAFGSDTAISPGYSWSGDNNTGMFRASTDAIGFSTGAIERARIDASGRFHVGNIGANYGKMEVLVGNFTSDLPRDGYWLRATLDNAAQGWLAGLTMQSDSGGTPEVSIVTTNAVTAGANTAQRAISIYNGGSNVNIRFYTNAEVERFRIDANGAWGLGGANYGTSGQVLTSNGSTTAPTWQNLTLSTNQFADGTVSAPSITFAADTNTGIYRSAADTLAFTTGGTQAMTLDAAGNTNVIGNLGVKSASPSSTIAINSLINGTGNVPTIGIQNYIEIADETLTANRNFYGTLNRATTALQSTESFSQLIEGARNIGQSNSASGYTTNSGFGSLIGSTNYGLHQSADATFNIFENVFGAQNIGQVSGATAFANNVYGTSTRAEATGSGSAVTAAFGVRSQVRATNAGATIGTGYLYYGDFNATGTITNQYGVYIASGVTNYFNGGIQIGGSASASANLGLGVGTAAPDVAGAVRVTEYVDAARGAGGSYGVLTGSGTNWGGNIWGIGPSNIGTGTGTTFAPTSHYGIAWLRSAHTSANPNIGEGLYIFNNGVLKGGIGDVGIYSTGSLQVDSNSFFNANVNITSGNLNFSGTGDQRIVSVGTADGADTGRIIIQASGGLTTARTAYIIVSGNEASSPGQLTLASGDTGSVVISGGSQGTIINGAGGLSVTAGQIAAITSDSASSPGYTWNSDTNMGIFRAAADVLGFSTGGAERVRIDAGGDVLIGSGTSVAHAGVVARLQVQGTTNNTSALTVARYNADTSGAILYLGKGRTGTVGQFTTAVVSGDVLGNIIFTGADTAAFSSSAYIRAVTTQTWTTSARGTRLEFATTANNSTSTSVALTLDQNNDATFTGAVTATSFSGSGASLTALNASQLTSGTLPNARISGAYSGITTLTLTTALIIPDGTASAPAIRFTSDTNCGIYRHAADTVGVNTALYVVGDITAFSDARVKTNIELVTSALSKVEAIRGVTYDRTDLETNHRYAGVIAQEVEEVLPEVVRTGDDGMKSVNYDGMAALFIEAIKELSKKVKVLEAKLAKYE